MINAHSPHLDWTDHTAITTWGLKSCVTHDEDKSSFGYPVLVSIILTILHRILNLMENLVGS